MLIVMSLQACDYVVGYALIYSTQHLQCCSNAAITVIKDLKRVIKECTCPLKYTPSG